MYNGDNRNFCNDCGSLQDCTSERVIDRMPPILVIILDRGLNNKSYKEEFYYDEYLDLSGFVPKDIIIQYYLSGVISHVGKVG